MSLTDREIWTVIHGMVFGFIFLLGFTGALYMVYSMKPELLTADGVRKTANAAKVYVWGLALSVWAAVFTGAFAPTFLTNKRISTRRFSARPSAVLLSATGRISPKPSI